MKSTLVLLTAFLLCPLSPLHSAEPARPVKPNIIFILVDDVGRDMYSCYGAENKTPNVDRLAAEGVRFQNAWCTPLCTPTRMEFLTGLYPYHSGWNVHHDVPRWGGKGFDPDKFICIARVLKQAGYATAIAGKWQINDLRQDKQIMRKHGFDQYCLWTGVEAGNAPTNRRYWDAYLEINGQRGTHAGKFGPEITQKFVLDFIVEHKDEPFFVYYPMIAAHGPLEPPPGPDGRRPEREGGKGLQKQVVAYLDRQVGDIAAKLETLGIADNTIIVFTGDNGTAGGGTLNGVQTPSGKGKVADMGVHVPLIFRAPMLARKAFVTEALADFTDLFPTFAELAGGQLPPNVSLDGRSLVPVLQGKETQSKPWIYSQLGANRIVRDARWLLHSSGAFYDLQADPFEKKDLRASATPEVVAARQRLAKLLDGLPADAPAPFEGYRGAQKKERKSKRK